MKIPRTTRRKKNIRDSSPNKYINKIAGTFPAAAYSLRKLFYDATNCITVRRSSDDAELTIGIVGNRLDTATLLAFVEAGDGFATTLHDQVGANNFTQSTADNQPKSVNSGTSLSGLLFDGSNDLMTCANPFGTTSAQLTVGALVNVGTFNMPGSTKSTAIISSWNSFTVGNQKGFLLRHLQSSANTNGWAFTVNNVAEQDGCSSSSISDADFNTAYKDKWLLIIGVFKGGEYVRIYLNNSKIAESTSTITAQCTHDTTIKIARADINSGNTNAYYSNVFMIDEALSETKLTQIYNHYKMIYPSFNL